MAKQPKERTPIQVEWNTDIHSIPRGETVNETRTVKGKPTKFNVWRTDKIWVVANGNFAGTDKTTVVTKTYWIPDENRWCGFVEGQFDFTAWAHYRDLVEGESAPEMKEAG